MVRRRHIRKSYAYLYLNSPSAEIQNKQGVENRNITSSVTVLEILHQRRPKMLRPVIPTRMDISRLDY